MGSWKNKIVASCLQEERDNKDFTINKDEIFGPILNKEHYQRLNEAVEFMESDPILANTHKFYEMTVEEMWQLQMQKTRRAFELNREKWFVNHRCNQIIWSAPMLGQNPCVLNYTMFALAIERMSNEEQYQKWGPLQKNYRISGTYAQTEIGHGSDVSSLQTTATFDRNTDEFVIHTPSIKATKWWPGDMGCFSSHAVVFAQLKIDDNKYGVQPFVVQLRDVESWRYMPGVRCGDMGPKMGYHSKNNGWCTFDQVRIPRDQMLMKYVSVNRDGNVSINGDLRALYSVMMDIRVQIALGSGDYLYQGCLIALRYSAVRRQFKNTKGSKEETKLLDYQTQQMKLFPLLGIGVSFLICHSYLLERYQQLEKAIGDNNFDDLDIMHHLTSGTKALYSQICFDGLMVIRQSIGGAGYSAWSGLPYLIDDFSATPTFEGDNTVMKLQASKYLQKMWQKKQKGQKLTDLFAYLNDVDRVESFQCNFTSAEQIANIDNAFEILKCLSLSIFKATNTIFYASKAAKLDKTNKIFALDLVKMSEVHIKYLTVTIARSRLSHLSCPRLRSHMDDLLLLATLTFINDVRADGFESGYFRPGTLRLIDDAMKLVLLRLRPQIIPLVENLLPKTDNHIMSAVGNSYGDIYETHFQWAKNSKMNQTEDSIPKGHSEFLLPILQGKI